MTHRPGVAPEDANMDATKGFVVPADGRRHLDMAAPGRFVALKLLGRETNESMLFRNRSRSRPHSDPGWSRPSP